MALSNSQYDAIMREYGRQQIENQHDLEERRRQVYERLPVIKELEREIEQLRSNNDALQTRINTEIDLDHVYKVATEELGMVYANKDQVRMYNKTESEYVRQYEDIPER